MYWNSEIFIKVNIQESCSLELNNVRVKMLRYLLKESCVMKVYAQQSESSIKLSAWYIKKLVAARAHLTLVLTVRPIKTIRG